MDSQKVIQVLKQIFDMYGGEIARKQSSFKAAVFDLLPGQEYKDERIVLRNAIEADALVPFVTASPITADTVAMAKERLRKTAHMTDEDTEFVIRCFVAALGINLETMTWKAGQDDKEDRRKQEEERRRQEENQRKQAEMQNQEKDQEKKLAVVAIVICAIIGIVFFIILFG